MKFVVFGGTGLIGKQVVHNLKQLGHHAVPASPSTGVNALTGEGLESALAGAEVVVDVTNSPSFEDAAVMNFFLTSNRNLLPAELAAGVRHHVALSVVGLERLPTNGYFRAKLAQEELIKISNVPFSIVRATQFFEFVGAIAQGGDRDNEVRLPPAMMQPIAARDVAVLLTEVAIASPLADMLEIAGPERIPQDELVRRYFAATNDPRSVIADAQVPYFGSSIDDQSLTPGPHARLGPTTFNAWLKEHVAN